MPLFLCFFCLNELAKLQYKEYPWYVLRVYHFLRFFYKRSDILQQCYLNLRLQQVYYMEIYLHA